MSIQPNSNQFFKVATAFLLLTATACNRIEDVCFECTAIGQGGSTTDRVCESTLAQSEMDAFRASFEAQYDPALYEVNCKMR
jgi:hypothetical protein